jgi:hypothetical protein
MTADRSIILASSVHKSCHVVAWIMYKVRNGGRATCTALGCICGHEWRIVMCVYTWEAVDKVILRNVVSLPNNQLSALRRAAPNC